MQGEHGRSGMKPSETASILAFFGMKREAGDIVDYLAIRFSLN